MTTMVADSTLIGSEVLETYRHDGYCRIENAVRRASLDHILEQIDALFTLQLERLQQRPAIFTGEESLLANMAALLQFDVDAYLAAARHAAKLISLQRLTASEAVEDIVHSFGIELQTLPTTPVLHMIADTLKIPDGYFGLAPHQDWPSVQGGLDSVTMWVPLLDVPEDRFPLEFIPGSHLQGLWPGTIREHALEVNEELYAEDDWVPVPAKRGDVVVFSGFTVHRTRIDGCRGLRIASSTRYENAREQTFVERGYPCAYKRTVEREFMQPNFPSTDQVARLFEPAAART